MGLRVCRAFLFFVSATISVQMMPFKIDECVDGVLEIVSGRTGQSVTCGRMDHTYNIYWSLNGQSTGYTETRIGQCLDCYGSNLCDADRCSLTPSAANDYLLTRTVTTTTLGFVDNLQQKNSHVLKCANFGNSTRPTCTINVIQDYAIRACQEGSITVNANKARFFTCDNVLSGHEVEWIIDYNDGFPDLLFACTPCSPGGTCPKCIAYGTNSRDFLAARTQSTSVLTLQNNFVRQNQAVIRCRRVTVGKQPALGAQCTLDVVYYTLPQCEGGYVTMSEDDPGSTPVACVGLRDTHNMNWTLTAQDGTIQQLAYCRDCQTDCANRDCSSDVSSGFTSSANVSTSLLFAPSDVRKLRQAIGQTITCIRRDGLFQDQCRLRVVYRGEPRQLEVELHGNFTVTLSTLVDRLFASDDNIACLWSVSYQNQTFPVPTSPRVTLSSYSFGAAAVTYRRMTCATSMTLGVTEGIYTFSVEVTPGKGMVTAGYAYIRPPKELRLQTSTCPVQVVEGDRLECQCQHVDNKRVSPPAVVAWEHDEQFGADHTLPDVLILPAVDRNLTNRVFQCRSHWGPNGEVEKTVDYSFTVAYGPSQAKITSPSDVISGLQNVTFTCTVDDVFPDAKIEWSIPCITESLNSSPQLSSACSFNVTDVMMTSQEVTCTAHNTMFPELTTKDSYRFAFAGEQRGTEESSVMVEAIAGGVGAAVVVIVVIAAAVFFIRRKRMPKQNPIDDKMYDTGKDDLVEYSNNIYEHSGEAGVASSNDGNQGQGSELKARQGNGSHSDPSNVYSNASGVKPSASADSDTYTNAASEPMGDVYAQVDKSKKAVKPRKDKPDIAPKPAEVDAPDVYQQVQKTPKGAAGNQASEPAEYYNCVPPLGDNPQDVYMNLAESSLLNSAKTVKDVKTDDVYNQLQFEKSQDDSSHDQYSHLGNL